MKEEESQELLPDHSIELQGKVPLSKEGSRIFPKGRVVAVKV